MTVSLGQATANIATPFIVGASLVRFSLGREARPDLAIQARNDAQAHSCDIFPAADVFGAPAFNRRVIAWCGKRPRWRHLG